MFGINWYSTNKPLKIIIDAQASKNCTYMWRINTQVMQVKFTNPEHTSWLNEKVKKNCYSNYFYKKQQGDIRMKNLCLHM